MRASDQINSTIQKIFDKQIGTSSHDDIVLWLYSKIKNGDPNEVSDALRLFDRKDIESKHWSSETRNDTTYYRKNIKVVSIRPILEAPIGVGGYSNSRIIGFADLAVEINFSYESSTVESFISSEGVKENKIENHGNQSDRCMCFVEVKTAVNVGETVRQIRYYQQGTGDYLWIVCAPAIPHVQILKDQGIGFIEYKPTTAPN